MKILSAAQTREWDQFTILHEPIASIDLMERAAHKCVEWLASTPLIHQAFLIFCGKGNNGGDGLAIARMLAQRHCSVQVYILEFGHLGTEDFQANLARLHQIPQVDIRFIQEPEHIPSIEDGVIVIDALFGSGLNRGIGGLTKQLVRHINQSSATIISIDLPSGMFTDRSSRGETVMQAKHTLSFQSYKLAFMGAENAVYTGQVHILDIGLDPAFPGTIQVSFEMIDADMIRNIYHPRNDFGHKGNFGHALIVAGSYGKMGAAILSGKACLRSGPGLLTCHIPQSGYQILQSAVPEAMAVVDEHEKHITRISTGSLNIAAAGIGPGLGTEPQTRQALKEFLQKTKIPVVLDADALNCLAAEPASPEQLPTGTILTPHPKEFQRLFGDTNDEFEMIDLALKKSVELKCVIVLKGHHSLIATPSGMGYFNSTGNAGMATGGSGDVLTGIITGLLCQGYTSEQAAILGVYLHGLAGDMAAERLSKEAMIAGDILDHLSYAFLSIVDGGTL